jgi:hypothetical protein
MRRIPLRLIAVMLNWIMFFLLVTVLLTSPYLIARFVPIEVASESLFSTYRAVGDALLGVTGITFITALLSAISLIGNLQSKRSVAQSEATMNHSGMGLEG